mgnify:CR=1 FL=1
MKYVSTRDNSKEYSFEDVFIKGLADDGGLYVPISLKKYSSRGWISGYQGHIFFKDASYVRNISYLLGIEYHQYDINIFRLYNYFQEVDK